MPSIEESIGRCIREQDEAAEYLKTGGKDRFGAMLSIQDWIKEEIILRIEAKKLYDEGMR